MASKDTHDPAPDAPRAEFIEVFTCGCGVVRLDLHDGGGEVFAVAPFSIEGAEGLIASLQASVDMFKASQPGAIN